MILGSKKIIIIFLLSLLPFVFGATYLLYHQTFIGVGVAKTDEDRFTFNTDWKSKLVSNEGVSVLVDNYFDLNKRDYRKYYVKTMSRSLPKVNNCNNVMVINGSFDEIHVFVGKKEILSAGNEDINGSYRRNRSLTWIMVPMSKEYSELPVDIIFSNSQDEGARIYNIYYGNKAAIYFRLMRDSFFSLILILVSILFSVISLILYRLLRVEKNNEAFLYIAMLLMGMSAWIFFETVWIWMITTNKLLISSLKYSSVMFIVFPMALYAKKVISKEKSPIVDFILFEHSIFCILAYLLKIFSVFGFHTVLGMIKVQIGIVLTCVLWEAIQNYIRERRFKMDALVAFSILTIGVVGEMINSFISGKSGITLIAISVLIFSYILTKIGVQESITAIAESKQTKYYEMLSTEDKMTGCKNQNAYSIEIDALSKSDTTGYMVAVVDLDGLKRINDCFGHHYGDDAIKHCIQCMYMAFVGKGRFYRTGGDEFLWVGNDYSHAEMAEIVEYFDELCESVNLEIEYPFGASIGYVGFDPEQDNDIRDTIKRADAQMYVMKREHHKKMDTTGDYCENRKENKNIEM